MFQCAFGFTLLARFARRIQLGRRLLDQRGRFLSLKSLEPSSKPSGLFRQFLLLAAESFKFPFARLFIRLLRSSIGFVSQFFDSFSQLLQFVCGFVHLAKTAVQFVLAAIGEGIEQFLQTADDRLLFLGRLADPILIDLASALVHLAANRRSPRQVQRVGKCFRCQWIGVPQLQSHVVHTALDLVESASQLGLPFRKAFQIHFFLCVQIPHFFAQRIQPGPLRFAQDIALALLDAADFAGKSPITVPFGQFAQ